MSLTADPDLASPPGVVAPMTDAHERDQRRRPLWRRIVFSILASPALHFLAVLFIFFAYNRLAYREHWVTSRPLFGDVAAPLYAQLENWVAEDLTLQEFPDWPKFWRDLSARAKLIAPPVAVFAIFATLIVAQILTRRFLPVWAMSLVLVAAAAAMNLSTAMIDGGPHAVVAPFARTDLEYYADVRWVRDDPAAFIRLYPLIARQFLSHHSQTHPPGPVLFLWAVSKLFGPGLIAASLAAIITTALAAAPAYWLARDWCGEKIALVAGAMYVLAPSLVLFGATCMDGVFAAFAVMTIWLTYRAMRPVSLSLYPGRGLGRGCISSASKAMPSPPPSPGLPGEGAGVLPLVRSALIAALAGIAMTVATFMTWATICIVFVFAAYALLQLLFDWRRGLRTAAMLLLAAGVFVACNCVLYRAVGYDFVACVRSSMRADEAVVASKRAHWIDVSFANLTAFLIGAGAIAVALWLRQIGRQLFAAITRRQADLLTLAFAIAIVAISFSRLFTLEVERIWLFLIPLVLIPAAREVLRIGSSRPSRVAMRALIVMTLLFAQTWLMEIVLYTWW